jgi:glycosyltransferase involved in cell wall biosynthesis
MMKRVAGLAPHLITAGHRVTIVAQDTAENRDYFAPVDGANRIFLPVSGVLSEVRQKARIVREQSPNVVYACGWGIRNLAALVGSITVVEHAELLSKNHESSALQRQKNLLLEWMSILFAEGLVLASQYLYDTYERRGVFGLTEKLRLPYGLSLETEAADGPVTNGPGTRVSKQGTTRVLYMGSLYSSLGIFKIVRSIPYIIDTEEEVEYVILGDGPDRKSAIELAESLGVSDHIQFEGYVDDAVLNDYLSSADVFLAPMFDTVKDKARCPSKIPMYMCHRKPIVTCRVGEAPRYLGENGFYYTPGDPQSMARQIVRASRRQDPVDYDLQSVSWKHLASRFLRWVENDLDVVKKKREA